MCALAQIAVASDRLGKHFVPRSQLWQPGSLAASKTDLANIAVLYSIRAQKHGKISEVVLRFCGVRRKLKPTSPRLRKNPPRACDILGP